MALRNYNNLAEELASYIKDNVSNKIELQKVLLFGSFAKGTKHEHSDIDVAIVSRIYSDCDYLDEMVKAITLFENFDLRVEPHLFTPEEIQKENDFVKEILNTGIVVYEN